MGDTQTPTPVPTPTPTDSRETTIATNVVDAVSNSDTTVSSGSTTTTASTGTTQVTGGEYVTVDNKVCEVKGYVTMGNGEVKTILYYKDPLGGLFGESCYHCIECSFDYYYHKNIFHNLHN